MRLLQALVIALSFALLAGCQGEAEMSKKETNTLSENLNKPVDVEKIRAEYAKENPGKTGNASGAAEGM